MPRRKTFRKRRRKINQKGGLLSEKTEYYICVKKTRKKAESSNDDLYPEYTATIIDSVEKHAMCENQEGLNVIKKDDSISNINKLIENEPEEGTEIITFFKIAGDNLNNLKIEETEINWTEYHC